MRQARTNTPLSITKVIEYIGKPAFFLFTIFVVTIYSFIRLITKLIQSFKVPKIPKLSFKFKFPVLTWRYRYLKIFLSLLVCSLVSLLMYFFVLRDLPSVSLLTDSPPSLSTKILDRHGELLYQIYKDQNRSLISLSELPPYVIGATLSAEDKNFYHHLGVDPLGIMRAFLNNIVKGTTQGGSTITQQLVKNTLLSPEKTLTRKFKELILAFEVEAKYSKDEILQMYLNQVGYGGTAYGIEEASHQYFGKSARDLTLSEAAMLAGLPIAPTLLSPFGPNPYLAKIRQQAVLESMVQSQLITEDEKVNALSTPLTFHPQDTTIRAPHFVMYIKDLLVKKYGEDMVARGGLVVTTSLDLGLQDLLQTQINTELAKLRSLHVQNGAGLILSPSSGEILAMVGSHDFFDSIHDGQVNIVMQPRQPGSSIKPITYSLAFSSGANPSTMIDDSPICFPQPGQPNYCPKNYDGRFHGRVTLRTALGSSYNIPAIKLLNTYGLTNMISLARSLGITTWDDPSRFGLSLTLGSGEVTMLDLASVYTVFANGGNKIPLKSILSVLGPKEADLPTQPNLTTTVVSPAVAYQITSILSDPLARAPAFGTHSVLNLPGANVAVKTGTTNDMRDNWTFGYTSDYLVATWVGNNDNTPMSAVASGITGASPIWARTMQSLLTTSPAKPFLVPSDMVKINISCTSSPRYEYFVPGNIQKPDCNATPSGTLLDSAASTSR